MVWSVGQVTPPVSTVMRQLPLSSFTVVVAPWAGVWVTLQSGLVASMMVVTVV